MEANISPAAASSQLRYPNGGLRRQLVFLANYFKTNLLINLEYRVAFISKVVGMLVNDFIWLFFWFVFFSRFPSASGYSLRDTLTLWVVTALGIGLSDAVFGNSIHIGSIVATGGLDYYLAVPKNVLFHLCISSMNVSAWGDIIFALAAFGILYQPDPLLLLVVLTVSFLCAVVFNSFCIIAQSLVFFLGNSEALANQIMFAIVTFSTYPDSLFKGGVKLLLYTLIPAAWASYVPVALVRHFDLGLFGLLLLATAVIVGLAIGIFYAGLRRYESGNLIQMRS